MSNNVPTIFVIFGATGDLIKKKIVPALYELYVAGHLPKLMHVVGFARRSWDNDAFGAYIEEILTEYFAKTGRTPSPQKTAFLKLFSYVEGNFTERSAYRNLAEHLGMVDNEWKTCANKLFYLAVPPQHYETIATHLHDSKLSLPCSDSEGWTRVLLEKPFGTNRKTAEDLDLLLARLFQEEQIYRIDHYLAKEMLQNILAFRFSNNLLESSWNNTAIKEIRITTLEHIGVEGRGAFYDGLGALRDVGQNHLLQMLALILMDRPANFSSAEIHEKRLAAFKGLPALSPEYVRDNTLRGQYEGYTTIDGVQNHSKTETYFKIDTYVNNPRWQGVKIILEAGKKFAAPKKRIEVIFRKETGYLGNTITFELEPEEGIKIQMTSKKPGYSWELEDRHLGFEYRPASARSQYVEEYAKLLLDCIDGNQLLFLRTDEIKEMWRFTDSITEVWERDGVPLLSYPQQAESIPTPFPYDANPRNRCIGIVGLGKMGGNMARRLLERDWTVIGYNRSPEATNTLAEHHHLTPAYAPEEFVKKLHTESGKHPAIVWLMLPAGDATQTMIQTLLPLLKKGDILVDAGNSPYTDDEHHAALAKEYGVTFLDVGFSGGPGGARNGACLMIGGDEHTSRVLTPLFTDVAMGGGFQYVGPTGAGHFVKMVHNGIEYGMMQALAEGFALLKKSPYAGSLTDIARIYSQGSVIQSKLVSWLLEGYQKYGEELTEITSTVAHTGEGAWTVEAAKKVGVPVPIIEGSLEFRKQSEQHPSYTGKVLSLLRNMFGGHKAF